MNIEIIAIGDEVLGGFCANTNASFISQELMNYGISPIRHTTIGDDPISLQLAVQEALQRGSCVITTGGLGSTCDDNTRKVIADLFCVSLEKRHNLQEALEKKFGQHPTLEDQSMLPQHAHALKNSIGTASGFIMQDAARFGKGCVICLPGVPHEMKAMFTEEVLDYLKEKCLRDSTYTYKIMHFAGLKEHMIDPLLREISERFPSISAGIYPGYSTVSVHLKTSSSQDHLVELVEAEKLLLAQFGDYIFEASSGKLIEAVHNLFIAKGLTLATAESCTGGGLAYAFVQNPQASIYFKGSIVAYSNEIKHSLLHVDEQLLKTKGAVSEEVTLCMAENVSHALQTDCAVAVSGIFGPSGGSEQKPVGTVCATIKIKGIGSYSWTMIHRGNRSLIHEKTVQEILTQLFLRLRNL